MKYREVLNEARPETRVLANDVLLRSGYHMMGSGSFATVYEKPGAQYVLKLFDADDLAYLAFVHLAQNVRSPHFPLLRGKPIRVTPQYYAIRMEKLTEYHGDPELLRVYTRCRDLDLDPTSYAAMQMGDAEELFYGDPTLKTALDVMMDNLTPDFIFDIKPDNIMARGNVLVFTDPVKNHFSNDPRKPIPMIERPAPAVEKPMSDKMKQILDDDDLMRELSGDA